MLGISPFGVTYYAPDEADDDGSGDTCGIVSWKSDIPEEQRRALRFGGLSPFFLVSGPTSADRLLIPSVEAKLRLFDTRERRDLGFLDSPAPTRGVAVMAERSYSLSETGEGTQLGWYRYDERAGTLALIYTADIGTLDVSIDAAIMNRDETRLIISRFERGHATSTLYLFSRAVGERAFRLNDILPPMRAWSDSIMFVAPDVFVRANNTSPIAFYSVGAGSEIPFETDATIVAAVDPATHRVTAIQARTIVGPTPPRVFSHLRYSPEEGSVKEMARLNAGELAYERGLLEERGLSSSRSVLVPGRDGIVSMVSGGHDFGTWFPNARTETFIHLRIDESGIEPIRSSPVLDMHKEGNGGSPPYEVVFVTAP